MSAYTTLYITRSKALQLYLEKYSAITNKELEGFLDNLLEPRLYNAIVVEDGMANDDNVV